MNIKCTGVIIKISFLVLITRFSYAQKILSEATLVYSISTQADKPLQSDPLSGATNTIYLKGNLSRTDMVSPLGKETTIYDTKTGSGVILKEYSGQKLMITLTKENWTDQNKKFEGIFFVTTSETKKIAGYTCTKSMGKLKDGSPIAVYYANDLITINKEYNQIFRNIQGLPMQYEFESGKLKFKYLLTSINLSQVPVSKFEWPKAGFRVMTYDENVHARKEVN